MELRRLTWLSSILCVLILLPIAYSEKTYDESDWIPINPTKVPESTQLEIEPLHRESKSSDRILNVEASGEFFNDGKFSHRKPSFIEHRPRKNPHIKRSPNQRPRLKSEPYRFESVLAPPPKHHQLKGFPQKLQYQGFNVQPQYQFNLGNQAQVLGQQAYQPLPSPPRYSFNLPQLNQNIPQYSTLPLGVQLQQQELVPQISAANNSVFQNPTPNVINSELFEANYKQNSNQNVKFSTPRPTDLKESVQLLYVPLEQLKKQPDVDAKILDEAFKSLQQTKLVAQPQEQIPQQQAPQALPLVSQKPQQLFLEEPQYLLQDQSSQINNQELPKYFELISKNRGELVLQNNPKTVHITGKQQFQVQSEPQQIVELTTRKSLQDSQIRQSYVQQQERQKLQQPQLQQTYVLQQERQKPKEPQTQQYAVQKERQNSQESQDQQTYILQQERQKSQIPQLQQSYVVQQESQKLQEPLVQQSFIQQTRNQFLPREPQFQQPYLVQQQARNPLTLQSPQLQQSYAVQNQPQDPREQSFFLQNQRENSQKSRLESIQRDILQQTLEVEKLQKQIQQGKSINLQGKTPSNQPPKKRKPHQPPLAVYMEGNNQGDIESVLEVLKNAKSIAVQDQIGPDSPQVFVGPSNLPVPEGFARFPLPYLSSLDNNRIQRKAQQFPFFVAPLNYREPEGYSKIPLPSPHVGSVVVSRLNLRNNPNQLDSPQLDSNTPVPITNYKFVNPAFDPNVENNANFDNNLNVYSLESSVPRESPNRQLKEQTLFQQITGFSGFDYPQNQYFQEVSPQPELKTPDQSPEEVPAKPIPSRQRDRGQTNQNQYFKEVSSQTEKTSEEVQTKPSTIRQRVRGENLRGATRGNSIVKDSDASSEKTQQTESRFQEIPPERVQIPENVQVSSQNPLTQDFLNRFGANNNQNYNFVSSTPNYGGLSLSSIEEVPANIKKLNVKPNQNIPDQRYQQAGTDGKLEQALEELQKFRNGPAASQEENKENEQFIRDFEQYELPGQFKNINPHLPGLINELQDQEQQQQPPTTTFRYETNPIVSTRLPVTTTQATTERTEPPSTTTTTKKPRGRGRGRFNMKSTTTTSPYRKSSSERRRPSRPTTESNSEESFRVDNYKSVDSERVRPRTRLQNTLNERVSEASVEATPPSQLQYQPITRVMEISQNQPNYFMEFQSTIGNERPVLGQAEEEPHTEGAQRVVEQYQSQKVTPAEELSQRVEPAPARQLAVTQSDRSEARRTSVTQAPAESEKPTRRRVRVRGRPKNKYSSTTIAPRTTTPAQQEEQTEFYGFIRQPQFSQSSQINNQNEEQNIHIYAPIQQKTSPVYIPRNYESTATSRIDTETTVHFLGELRPKYSSPSRGTTPSPDSSSTQRIRTRGRVRIPGRTYESKTTSQENQTTEKYNRVRQRGRTHFTPPRNTRQEEPDETENYPASYLRSRESSSTPSSSEFKITVDAGDERDDQIPYSTMNRAQKLRETTAALPQTTTATNEDEKNYIEDHDEQKTTKNVEIMSFRDERMKQDGFKVVNVDQFDTAESQDYRSLFNSIGGPTKVNELKSKEVEETMTVTPMNSFEKQFLGMEGSSSSGSSEGMSTMAALTSSTEDLLTSEVLRNTSESSTTSSIVTSTGEVGVEVSSTISTDSMEGGEITSTMAPEEELRMSTSTEAPKTSVQTALDLLVLQTSTSTEISHETEICYKGRCSKSRSRKLRKPVS